MSVVEKLSKLFSKKSDEAQAETSGDLSLAAPDASANHLSTGAMDAQVTEQTLHESIEPDSIDDSVAPVDAADDSMRLQPVGDVLLEDVEKINPLMERAEKNAATVMGQQKILTQVGSALRTINRQSSDLLEIAETVSSLKLQQNAPPAEISAAGQLAMLTQRIGKSANEFLTMAGVSPEAVFLLGKDLNSFKEIAQGLLEGSPELRLAGSKDPQTRERLAALMKLYEQTRTQAGAILG